MLQRAALVFLLAVSAFVAACGHGAPVRNPASLVAATSVDATQMAILDALPRARWTAEQTEPGRIIAFMSTKKYLLRAELRYDASKVDIQYIDSDNLGAREHNGQIIAHANVSKWLQRLAAVISKSLAAQPR